MDGGVTWQQAWIVAKHPVYAIIPGTEYVFCGPTVFDSCGVSAAGISTLYRTTFTLPAGFSNPSLSVDVHADNAAIVYLNGVEIGRHPCHGTFTCEGGEFSGPPETFYTTNPAPFQVGANTLQFDLWDFGVAAGLDYLATVTYTSDTTPPTVACSVTPNKIWPPNHKMVTVNASVSVSDADSGPAGFTLVSATSNEPDNGLGDGDMPNDVQGFAVGTADTSGQVRAERSGLGSGRVYTLTYQGMDQAGNSATCSTTISVPHDQGK